MTDTAQRTLREEFTFFITTTNLRRDGGTISHAGDMDTRKVGHMVAAMERLAHQHASGVSIGTTAREVGSLFWRYVINVATVAGERTSWSHRLYSYPADHTACEQIGEWLIEHRHLASTVEAEASPVAVDGAAPISAMDPVWLLSERLVGQVVSVSSDFVVVNYVLPSGAKRTKVQIPRSGVVSLVGVDLVIRQDNARSTYSGDTGTPVEEQDPFRFVRWWNRDRGLAADQAIYINNGLGERYVPSWRLAPRSEFLPVPVIPSTVDQTDRWVYRRSDGLIAWAQGWSRSGNRFDAYARSREGSNRLGTFSWDEGWADLTPGTPLVLQLESSHGYSYVTGVGGVVYYHGQHHTREWALTVHHERHQAGANYNGYVSPAHVRVQVADAPATDAGHVVVVDGVEYVRKSVVDEDVATIARVFHAAAESNGLCPVYDRTVRQANSETTLLNLGDRYATRRVTVTETYEVTRVIEVPESRSDEHARSVARSATALPRPSGVESMRRINVTAGLVGI